jgi:molybdopterin molybdotransferase
VTDPTDRRDAASALRARVESLAPAGDPEQVAPDAVADRTTARTVTAPADVPARPFATMDGFALSTGDDGPRSVAGQVGPADDPDSLGEDAAVRVDTGAPLPARADAVVPVEDATVTDGRLDAPALAPATNVYPAGATAAADEVLFPAGTRLAPRHAALLRDVGVDSVPVRPRLSVGVLATGTEIYRGEQPDRDSDVLANLFRRWGHEPTVLSPVPDERGLVEAAVGRAVADHDVVVTSGGTSAGAGDHVGRVLAPHDPLFAGVALRPGRPATAAVVDGTPVCALPGKPLAAHAAAALVLRPAFTGERGDATTAATVDSDVALPAADVEYAVPVALDDGRAVPVGQGDDPAALYGSRFRPGRVASSTRCTLADGLVVTRDPLVAGESVAVTPYEVVE